MKETKETMPLNPSVEDLAQAEERISIARERLILTQPFYSSILMNLEDTFLDEEAALARGISTMATDGHSIFYNLPAIARLDIDVVVATMVEEVIHVCHLHHVRMVGLHGPTFNVAADIRIAHDLKLEGYTLNPAMLGAQPQYAQYQDQDQYDAEAIYWAILDEPDESTDEDQDQTDESTDEDQEDPGENQAGEDQDDEEDGQSQTGGGDDSDSGGDSDAGDDVAGGTDDDGPGQDGEGQPGEGSPSEGPGTAQDEPGPGEGGSPTDGEQGPGQASQVGLTEDEAMDLAAQAGFYDPTGVEHTEDLTLYEYNPDQEEDHVGQASMGGVLPMNEEGHVDAAMLAEEQERVHDMIIQAHRAAKGMGLAGGFGLQMFEAILQPRDDVARILDQMLQQARSQQTTWARPNRRHIHSGLYLPGQGKEKKLNIAMGFDVSGSMGDDDYKASLDLSWGVLSAYDVERVDLVQIDTAIKKIQTIEVGDDVEIEQSRRGFGGSNMAPFFDLLDQADEPYDLAVLFTDGGVMWPQDEPDIPCLIVYIGTYVATEDAPIGTTVRLEK